MAIDLLDIIRDDKAIKSGGFTCAIFLTYTLNLTFFEQILVPALDQAGCSSVLIMADPDGYHQALEMGAKSINGVGLQYVCVPVIRKGRGVQHAKMLFMVGPGCGRLLIGSGNLTFHGYSRNLELYSHFEFDSSDPVADNSPFVQAWALVQELAGDGYLSIAAHQQIMAIQENVVWLRNPSSISETNVWHNFRRPLLDQLVEWRNLHGFKEPALKVSAISPYYDHNLSAVKQLANNFAPTQLQIYLDPAMTNLDGKEAKKIWRGITPKLTTYAIGPSEEQVSARHVHAKAIVGHEKNGSWCITGSANLSYPALQVSWQSGGNLELVTIFGSEDPKAFDYLLKDEMVQTWSIDLSSVIVTESEPSEKTNISQFDIFLTDLNLHRDWIEGILSSTLPDRTQGANLHLQRNNIDIPVQFQDELVFRANLKVQLDEPELARLESGNFKTPYRWIDQPEVLTRHGARTYQVRVKGKLETLLGAEKLFEELMNFLLERIDSEVESEDQDPRIQRRRLHHISNDTGESSSDPLPPGPEEFITDEELVHRIHSGLDHHLPYDRSLLSLRDLLSLVLLRLTTQTQTMVSVDRELHDEEQDQKKQAELEELQTNILQRLSDYLLRYCRRYSNKLIEDEFLQKISPEVIFQNQYTLGKVLLDFSDKATSVFTQEDFLKCLWLIWAPLVWPEIIGLDGSSTLKIIGKKIPLDRIRQLWYKDNMPSIATVMFSETLGQPPNWNAGLSGTEKVETFITAREWINRSKQILGNDAFEFQASNIVDPIERPTISGIFSSTIIDESYIDYLRTNFSKIENYLSPIEEKFAPLIELDTLERVEPSNWNRKQVLIEQILAQGLEKPYKAYKNNLRPILGANETDEGIYCPRCGASQSKVAQYSIEHGELMLCTYIKDAWIFLRPNIPKRII